MRRWRFVLGYLKPYWRIVIGGIFALIVANAAMIAVPALFKRAMLAIEAPLEEGRTVDYDAVVRWSLLALALAAVSAAANFSKRFLIIGSSRRVEADLRRDLFRHIERLPLSYFDATRTGDLLSRATADIEAVRMAIGPSIMYLIDSILKSVGVVVVMWMISPELTLWGLAPLVGIAIGLFFFAPRIHKASRAVQDGIASISARAQESFAGGRVVKTFATEDFERSELDGLGRDYLAANVRLARVRGLTTAWTAFMGATAVAIMLFVGGAMIIDGRFTVSELLQFHAYQAMLIWPMIAFGWVLALLQRGRAGLERIQEVFALAPESDQGSATGDWSGELSVRQLGFAYNGQPVLADISFELPAGSTLGIVGPTGSGKSTLISLLARLYDPPRGTVFLDGRDIHDIALKDLRGAIALVPQEAFLFSASIRENVLFGRPGAPDTELLQAIEDARLADDLAQFPAGIETIVGERGVTLSGGQKQRTTLARAIATDAPILVLDDALSAVDSETETAILDSLRRVRRDRTAIIVAHRVSALRDADHILVLRDGRVIEEGSHEELLDLDGEYARLARAQALEEEIEAMD
ncbi:MAG: ABC transporter ATP-binding protein [Planctomycetota bacterium]|jgi:ATP-binding cassette subfamily B protein